MSDGLKSAWEVALEKLEAEGAEPAPKLDARQKEEIAELRGRYQAKIAAAEIGIQASIQKAARAGDAEQVELLRAQLLEQRRKFETELEARLDEVRARGPEVG